MAQELTATMDTARKLNDCYFYYYSTCTKGDNCVFRHEPSALGCETMCTAWQQGKCADKKCKLRHMELRKNRKQIPCYWESQPCGCRKKHCPFMHRNPEARTDGIAPSQMTAPSMPAQPSSVPLERSACEPPMVSAVGPVGVPPRVPTASVQPTVASVPLIWQREINRSVMLESGILGVLPASSELMGGRPPAPNYAAVPVDSLVVNFDEESDNESVQSTPKKALTEGSGANEAEELELLERIQAEAAAYYAYSGERTKEITHSTTATDFKVLSLDEIRARKKSIDNTTPIKFNRKRKLSSRETIIDSGNNIIKLVRSNSIVYKKVDQQPTHAVKQENKPTDTRKRTYSEHSDVTEQDNELLDECFQFKRIKADVHTIKPRLIRNIPNSTFIDIDKPKDDEVNKSDSAELAANIPEDINSSELYSSIECETIDLDTGDVDSNESDIEVQVIEDVYKNIEGAVDGTVKTSDAVVDLCDGDDGDVIEVENKHFPDVVTSCHAKVDDIATHSRDSLIDG